MRNGHSLRRNPQIEAFLDLLSRDISDGKLAALPSRLVEQAETLTKGVPIDADSSFQAALSL
jgi:hypothetical protein